MIACVWLALVSSASLAQTAPPSSAATNEKIQELIRLLGDPEVRAALEAAQKPAAETAQPAAATQIARWESGIRGHLRAMRDAFPRIPEEAENAVTVVKSQINNRGFGTVFVLFAALLALGFGAEWLFRRMVSRARLGGAGTQNGVGRPRAANLAVGLLSQIVPIVVFALVSAGIFLAFSWPPLLRLIILTYLVAVVAVRVVLAFGRILLDPDAEATPAEAGPSRLIRLSDADARFWFRRLTVFVSYLMLGWATLSVLPALGFSPNVHLLLSYLAGIGLLLLAIEIIWRRPGQQAATGRAPRNALLSIYIVVLWGLWVLSLDGLLWIGIYALLLPRLLTITGQATESVVQRQGISAPENSFRAVMIVRGARALVILLAVLWLGLIWRLNPSALTESDSPASRIMRGILHGAIILLVADLIWHLAKAYIGRKLDTASEGDTLSPEAMARRDRLRTLLPIFRNLLGVVIATVAILTVLSGLGVQIGPLIAGAGIFGVAIGFGSQTLVKDIISGVFYMLDDAFRVGEYIESGSYKGTVESFSLRSVKLRNHRGPVFTVPFGELGAVQNMSRDWAIDKFMIRVPFDTDIAKVKKLVKGVGAELMTDPEVSPYVIETVKMKGVEEIGDFGIQISFAFMTKPGYQSYVRRRAYTAIRGAFMANGIEFAQPTVQVGSEEKSTAAAAASATASALARKNAQVVS